MSPNTLRVREAGLPDLERLIAFQQSMAWESEEKRLDPERLRRGIAALLGDPERGRYLVCEGEGRVLGCLMLTREWSDWRNGWFWWIQSVYTDIAARGKGVFRALYDAVLLEARARGDVCGLRLYVEHDNHAAHAIYEHVGLLRSHYLFYELELSPAESGAG